ncbi:MAG: tRNA-intron lyase [Candidatus Parvarchaeota archaeon]|nr:tRNA-intron lyase [Candidatus Parvarchaeota archaeon]MCL5101699.1 tRNA-intron lyase [Candidatus Parvarchaeota archaeon]
MEKTILRRDRVIIFDQKLASKTFNKGYFGEFENGKLILSLEEAFYLMEVKGLDIYDNTGKKLTKRSFLDTAEKRQKKFWVRYSVLKDLRAEGYLPKTAFKYGGDFRVYNKGDHPGEAHATWILYAATEHESMPLSSFAAINRVAHSVRKKALFAVVDDEDAVTYYEIGWIKI